MVGSAKEIVGVSSVSGVFCVLYHCLDGHTAAKGGVFCVSPNAKKHQTHHAFGKVCQKKSWRSPGLPGAETPTRLKHRYHHVDLASTYVPL